MDMWVTTKIDFEAAVVWTKYFTVDLNTVATWSPFFVTFLMEEEKKVVVCHNAGPGLGRNMSYIIGEDDECYSNFPLVQSDSKTCLPFIFSYAPSLLQIQEGLH